MQPVPQFNTQGKRFYTIVPKNAGNRTSIDKFVRRYTLNPDSEIIITNIGANTNFNPQNVIFNYFEYI